MSPLEIGSFDAALERIAALETELASLCDLLNSWARESRVEEAASVDGVKEVADRLWMHHSAALAEANERYNKEFENVEAWHAKWTEQAAQLAEALRERDYWHIEQQKCLEAPLKLMKEDVALRARLANYVNLLTACQRVINGGHYEEMVDASTQIQAALDAQERA